MIIERKIVHEDREENNLCNIIISYPFFKKLRISHIYHKGFSNNNRELEYIDDKYFGNFYVRAHKTINRYDNSTWKYKNDYKKSVEYIEEESYIMAKKYFEKMLKESRVDLDKMNKNFSELEKFSVKNNFDSIISIERNNKIKNII